MARETRESKQNRLEQWAAGLTVEQLRAVVVELTMDAIDAEMVRFWDDTLAPYWEGNGEPIVPGQKTYPDEEA